VKRYSIRRRLMVFLLGSLLLAWSGMMAWNYREAREEIDELADEQLEESVRTLMQLDLKRLAAPMEAAPASGDDSQDHAHGDHDGHVAFQIWDDGGRLLLRSRGAPASEYDRRQGHASIRTGKTVWRSYALRDARLGYQVRAFEDGKARDHLIAKLARRTMQALLLTLPALALLIWIGIGRGLKPLTTVSEAIAARDAGKLEPIALERVPDEVRPLIDSLNRLLRRLAESFDKERAFTADAAHELRTPLAAIKVQAEVALAARDETQRSAAIRQVIAGVNRSTRLVQQLLLLARLDHPDAAARQPVDLGAAAAECAAVYADQALRNNIELELSAAPGCIVQADPAMLSVLIGNLIDNAVKYGRANGRVAIAIGRDDGGVSLSVKDDGPGVPPESRARLLDRFFRAADNQAEGSGLGLAIVARIAAAYRAQIALGVGLDGRGLGVTLRFPQPGSSIQSKPSS
jgi:two-component system sensor histidine kinase QseC